MTNVVPSVDLRPFIAGGVEGKRTVADEIKRACEEIGFFKIRGHGVPQVLVERAFATAGARGYHALRTKTLAKTLGYDNPPDLREQFYIGPLVSRAAEFAHIPGAAALYAENIWPDAPADYREVFTTAYRALEGLGGTLMRVFAVALDIDEHFFDDKIDRHFSTLPVNHYPEPDGDALPNQIRAGEHTDFGSLTILAVNQRAGGLQVKLHDGSWLDVTAEPDEFIVNIADMMQRWTNDRWLSNVH